MAAGARDGDIAIRQEFDAAAQMNTVAAWQLFLTRHPDHPLARQARLRLDALTGQQGTAGKGGSTIAVEREFDAAAQANTIAAWEAFIARHPQHPLTRQARLRLDALKAQTGTPPPPPRDGNVAIRQEFDAAAQANTVAAWELFIARHPKHPLTDEARRRLDRLRTQSATPPPRPRDGDIAVQQEFDAAARKNTVAAWETFLARHANHPLAVEAARRLEAKRNQ